MLADIPSGREIGSDPHGDITWYFRWCGFQYGEIPTTKARREVKYLIFPYSPIVIPLTLLFLHGYCSASRKTGRLTFWASDEGLGRTTFLGKVD